MTASWRFLAEPPPIPGLVLRGFRGEEDFPAMRRVKLAAEAADGLDQPVTLEDFAVTYRHLQNCDPATDMVLAEIDGDLVAYGRVTWWEEYTGARRYTPFCFVAPEGRGRGLGTAMLAHGEARLRQIAAGHSAAGSAPSRCSTTTPRPGPPPCMPRRATRRFCTGPTWCGPTWRTSRTRRCRRAWWCARRVPTRCARCGTPRWTPSGITSGPPRRARKGSRSMLDSPYYDPSLWCVAWDGDEVAGQVRSFINGPENEAMGRRRGYTENISVRRPYRRRGLARALLVRSLHAVKERGMEEASLGVLTENVHGAFRLYESVGFRVVRSCTTLRKPLD